MAKQKKAKSQKRLALDEQLRQAIQESGLSPHALSKLTGVSYPPLFYFAQGKRDLYLVTAGKIAAALGLHLAPIESRR